MMTCATDMNLQLIESIATACVTEPISWPEIQKEIIEALERVIIVQFWNVLFINVFSPLASGRGYSGALYSNRILHCQYKVPFAYVSLECFMSGIIDD